MTVRSHLKTRCLATALAAGLAGAPASAQITFDTFDGGGSGSTAEGAINAAIDDASSTASGFGLYSCVMVGQPQVFFSPTRKVRPFSAQVQLRCT